MADDPVVGDESVTEEIITQGAAAAWQAFHHLSESIADALRRVSGDAIERPGADVPRASEDTAKPKTSEDADTSDAPAEAQRKSPRLIADAESKKPKTSEDADTSDAPAEAQCKSPRLIQMSTGHIVSAVTAASDAPAVTVETAKERSERVRNLLKHKLSLTDEKNRPKLEGFKKDKSGELLPCLFERLGNALIKMILFQCDREVDIKNVSCVSLVMFQCHDAVIHGFGARFLSLPTEEQLRFFGICPRGLGCRPKAHPQQQAPLHVMDIIVTYSTKAFVPAKFT